MTVNLYLVWVKNNGTSIESLYYYLTNKTMETYQEQGSKTLTYKFLTTLQTEPEQDFYKSLKYFFNLRNIDCYYLNTFTKQHYYMPSVYIRKLPKELPTAHTIPSLKISLPKLSKSYKETHYSTYEKIIERPIIVLSPTTNILFEELNTYLKTPNAYYYYNFYNKIFNDSFKSFLIIIRDYLTTSSISYPYYLYSYMGSFQLLGYYPKKEKAIEEWIRNDRGKDLRQNLILLPFTMPSIIALWNSFNSSNPTKESEDLI